jgi:hypothetical protein
MLAGRHLAVLALLVPSLPQAGDAFLKDCEARIVNVENSFVADVTQEIVFAGQRQSATGHMRYLKAGKEYSYLEMGSGNMRMRNLQRGDSLYTRVGEGPWAGSKPDVPTSVNPVVGLLRFYKSAAFNFLSEENGMRVYGVSEKKGDANLKSRAYFSQANQRLEAQDILDSAGSVSAKVSFSYREFAGIEFPYRTVTTTTSEPKSVSASEYSKVGMNAAIPKTWFQVQ